MHKDNVCMYIFSLYPLYVYINRQWLNPIINSGIFFHGHWIQELSFLSTSPPGLRGTEMWGGGFSTGYELFGQIFISGGYKKNKTTASGSYMHVSRIQNEGNCSLNSRETLHLHWQLCPARRTAGNWVLHKYIESLSDMLLRALLWMKILRLLFITFYCERMVKILQKRQISWFVFSMLIRAPLISWIECILYKETLSMQ